MAVWEGLLIRTMVLAIVIETAIPQSPTGEGDKDCWSACALDPDSWLELLVLGMLQCHATNYESSLKAS